MKLTLALFKKLYTFSMVLPLLISFIYYTPGGGWGQILGLGGILSWVMGVIEWGYGNDFEYWGGVGGDCGEYDFA
jgi:hypothetical protein